MALVEHMIQKNQCLFTNTQCKVCCALLISESQKLAHYQKSSRSKDKNQCCPICNMTFSSPVVAQSHYLGKTHAKNLKLKQQSTKVEALSKRLTNPFLVASTLALHQNREAIDPDKFCSLCHATFNDPVMAQQHYVGKKHRKQETKLKLMAHYGRLADPAVADSSGSFLSQQLRLPGMYPRDSVVKGTTHQDLALGMSVLNEGHLRMLSKAAAPSPLLTGRLSILPLMCVAAGKGYPCKTCKIVLNSIEQYQAHVSGFKHKNQ
ncbi:zinc finger protein 346 [Camelus ferus]|nr:zinc finger protein 346 [Camelus ferus]